MNENDCHAAKPLNLHVDSLTPDNAGPYPSLSNWNALAIIHTPKQHPPGNLGHQMTADGDVVTVILFNPLPLTYPMSPRTLNQPGRPT
jgi:hypothetical protein